MNAPNTPAASGHLPPDDVAEGELWQKLTQLPRPFELLDFPRRDPMDPSGQGMIGQVACWVLNQTELMASSAAADAYAKQLLRDKQKRDEENLAYADIYKNAASVEVVFRAYRRPENLKHPAFPSTKKIRDNFSSDEIAILTRNYLQVQRKLGPIVTYMSEAEMNAWLERLAKDGQLFPLALLDSDQLEDLLRHSARRLYPSSMVTSSAGALQTVTSTDPSSDDDSPPLVEADDPPDVDLDPTAGPPET
jgi:hypothetical protein